MNELNWFLAWELPSTYAATRANTPSRRRASSGRGLGRVRLCVRVSRSSRRVRRRRPLCTSRRLFAATPASTPSRRRTSSARTRATSTWSSSTVLRRRQTSPPRTCSPTAPRSHGSRRPTTAAPSSPGTYRFIGRYRRPKRRKGNHSHP